MSTVIADMLESEESARRLESDLASCKARAEKAEAERDLALKELAKYVAGEGEIEQYEAKLEACRALVARLDDTYEQYFGGYNAVPFRFELNAAREALK